MRHCNPPAIHAPAGRYSHSVRVPAGADTLYVAGQVGALPDGRMADGFTAQVHQAFANLLEVLAANGMAASDLVQLTYYLPPDADVAELRRVRDAYLSEPPPASTVLVVHALARPEWLFEIDGIAAQAGALDGER